ncbi:hypothetical protein ACFLXP_04665 [Chloroflexota bacterium]
MGLFDDNPMHYDVNEAANLVGLDFLVNCIVNSWGEIAAVYTGTLDTVHAAAVKDAKNHYLTPTTRDKDIVIANNFTKANETRIGLSVALPVVKNTGGDIVLIGNTPDGQATHYLLGPFGKTMWADLHQTLVLPPHINHLIVFSEYPHRGSSWMDDNEKVIYINKWDEVLEVLQKYHGPDTKVSLFPNSAIQYCV